MTVMRSVAALALVLGSLPLTAQARPEADALSREIETRMVEVMPKVVAWRRDIHQHPELSGQEVRTAALVHDNEPETNYFAASHLAWCGRPTQAFHLLDRAIRGGYCSWPVIDTDPYFASVRSRPEFADLRKSAEACQKAFLTAIGPTPSVSSSNP